MKELYKIDEKKTEELIKKFGTMLVTREEMHKLRETASKTNTPLKGKLFSESEKIRHEIEDIKVPDLKALNEE